MNQLPYHSGPEQPTPEQRLMLMNDESWESFIEQCARQLKEEGNYLQVLHLGGAGDKGRDVCGYCESQPVENSWDIYQGKFYEGTLSPSAFAADLAKFLWHVFSQAYTRPRNYYICALRVGPKLIDYVLNPIEFKAWIIKEWAEKNGDFKTFKQVLTPELKAFIESFPFDIIKIKPSSDLLEIHSRSDKHWEVFGVLGSRGPNPTMPDQPLDDEHKYIKALLDVYGESQHQPVLAPSDIPSKFQKHFKSQRMMFYSAEGLNRFSRDKLPGAFDDLVTQIEIGIGSDIGYPHPSGLDRLTKVLDKANSLQVTSNPLHRRLQAGDLGGTCHHLANQDRASWVDKNE
jgi:hypothetical protein